MNDIADAFHELRRANLARALLNVVRNKGAPGVDGQTVEDAQRHAASFIAELRHALLRGRYRPGEVRRVWLPKPGGGQRGLSIPINQYKSMGFWKKQRIFSGLRCKESIDDFTLLLKSARLAMVARPTVSVLRCFQTSSSGFLSGEYGGR